MIKFEPGITESNKGYGMPEYLRKDVSDFDPAIFDITWTEDGGVQIESAADGLRIPSPEEWDLLEAFLEEWREYETL